MYRSDISGIIILGRIIDRRIVGTRIRCPLRQRAIGGWQHTAQTMFARQMAGEVGATVIPDDQVIDPQQIAAIARRAVRIAAGNHDAVEAVDVAVHGIRSISTDDRLLRGLDAIDPHPGVPTGRADLQGRLDMMPVPVIDAAGPGRRPTRDHLAGCLRVIEPGVVEAIAAGETKVIAPVAVEAIRCSVPQLQDGPACR